LEDRTVPSSAVQAAYGRLPLSFEANQGQTDAHVNFLSRGQGYSLFLTPTQAVLDTSQSSAGNVLSMQLLGSDPAAHALGLEQLPGVSNYLIGNDPSQWHTNIPNYARVEYQNVYPGIDLVYYGNNQQHLEYDFVLAPGANPNAIQLSFQGTQGMTVDSQGNLVLHTAGGDVVEQAPVLYQASNGVRQSVSGHYVLESNSQVGFQVGAYDPTRPLIIDPTYSLVYSTYLGVKGSSSGAAIAVDGSGDAYVTGTTTSTNFPTSNPWQASNAGGQDVFVTKLNATGTGLVYSTYLGGSGDDLGLGIALDSSGNAYITGDTHSSNFPTLNAFQPVYPGGAMDGFVSKFNATGGLVYSTYLGGSGGAGIGGIAVDTSGNAYVSGATSSKDFPTTAGAFQTSLATLPIGGADGFVVKLNASGSALVYSTYLGGATYGSSQNAIAVDTAGEAYVTGFGSGDYPITSNAFQTSIVSTSATVVSKLNATGSGLLYSTFLGASTGSALDQGLGIAVDAAGDAYVTGETGSTVFPIKNGFQTTFGGNIRDAFVSVLNPAASGAASLLYSSYLGGSSDDQGNAIAVDSSGKAYATGYTYSANFPTANAFQPTFGGYTDAFVTAVNPALTGAASLVYSSYLGGNNADSGAGIAVDTSGNAYVTGSTRSKDFPTTKKAAFQTTLSGDNDAFVTKIDPPATITGSLGIDTGEDTRLAAASAVRQPASDMELVPVASSLVGTGHPPLQGAPLSGPAAPPAPPASQNGIQPATGASSPASAAATDAVFAASHPEANDNGAWLLASLSPNSLDAI
jgi:hypothetical protein